MLSSFSKLEKFCIFVISNNKSFISQNLKVVVPFGGKFDFFSPLGFKIQSDFDYRTAKSGSALSELWKLCYVNEKNLIHGRVTATISKFSPQIFETYFNLLFTAKNATLAYAASERPNFKMAQQRNGCAPCNMQKVIMKIYTGKKISQQILACSVSNCNS